MQFDMTTCSIKNTNPRKESGDDGQVLATDVSVTFTVPLEVVNAILPGKNFMDQFFDADDVKMEALHPITLHEKIEDLRITFKRITTKPLVFEGARIKSGMKLTPFMGRYIACECKLQLHPSVHESGLLDGSVKEHADIAIERMGTVDMEDAEAA